MVRTIIIVLCSFMALHCAAAAQQPTIPPVLLTNEHAAMCRVRVGDTLPAIELEQLGGSQTRLSELYGRVATVVVFWKADRRMSHMALADLERDVVQQFGSQGAEVISIAVNESPQNTEAALQRAQASYPTLLDPDGQVFAQVGAEKLPRLYLVDSRGKILWFDIEYSLATRRELNQALQALLNGG